ncbi:TPA: hypothetical protein ACOTFX_001016 [Clostridium perfringens]|uniref:hypothetical protein n=1 Tax=Clostridium perfringens TaxID=1502 RepID=UPI001009C069|nr:hypothetical protein [Clostridium perfringens]EJT5939589.1 hypothetical protein [Clostridium perfringens]EJT6471679.1 hypothetical protein [Clostridium perfringens]RXI81197.1 hypothetical protein C6V94_05340 [Clostridium perfringens]RXI84010.1 hypothetical protein C6V96_06255 [Clostridium perfringens]RXI86653.1 hypothetical protein C6V92_04065 [Clostridium perfringens]
MKKSLKRSGLILSAALGISLIGQVAYAAQSTYAQTAIEYNFRLPKTGYLTTSRVTKTNRDGHADNYVSYFGWPGSGVDWWICNSAGTELTDTGHFEGTTTSGNPSRAYYKGSYGSDYYGHKVYAKIKTDAYTWNECDVKGKIYP